MGRAPMYFRGQSPADRPDPLEELRAQARAFGIRAAGLTPQRHLEDRGISGLQISEQGMPVEAVTQSVTLWRTYTVWQNPDDRHDPVNFRPVDDDLRRMQASATPDDVPAWIVQMRDRVQYPMLWEAVQTHWAPGTENSEAALDVSALLTAHVDYILHNSFRVEYGLGDPTEEPWKPLVRRAAVQRAGVIVDDAVLDTGVMIDTDPFVIGLGAPLPDGRAFTAVVSRSLLDFVTLEFVADGPDEPADATTS